MATQKRRENDYTKEGVLCQAPDTKKFTFLQKRRKVLNMHSVNCGLPLPAPPRQPIGRDKVSPRPVKVRHTLTKMSCGGVKLWYNISANESWCFVNRIRRKGSFVMKKKSMLAAFVMLSLLHGSVYAGEFEYDNRNGWTFNGEINVSSDNKINKVDSSYNDYDLVLGNGILDENKTINITHGIITIDDNAVIDEAYGAYLSNGNISNTKAIINDGKVEMLSGGLLFNTVQNNNWTKGIVNKNVVEINGGNVTNAIYAGSVEFGNAVENTIDINTGILGDRGISAMAGRVVYGNTEYNNLIFDGASVTGSGEFYGGYSGFGSSKYNKVEIRNIIYSNKDDYVAFYGGVSCGEYFDINTFERQHSSVEGNIVNFNTDNVEKNNKAEEPVVGIVHEIVGGSVRDDMGVDEKIYVDVMKNEVNLNGNACVKMLVVGGQSIDGKAEENAVIISDNSKVEYIKEDADDTYVAQVIGGLSESGNVIGNSVTLSGSSTVIGNVIAGSAGESTAELSGNTINLFEQANVEKADLFGYQKETSNTYDNNLVIDKGWTGEANSVQNFNNIKFNNLVWNTDENAAVLTTNSGNLGGTNVSFTLQSGQKVNVGESMTLISSSADLGTIANAGESLNTTIGLSADVSAVLEQSADNKTVTTTIKDVKLNDQTMLVAENRAVAAAFVNQGTDLIADSLDTLSRDGKYGVKTFAAVHGNRSKYDVNSDLKINGWSTIVGVGSETEHNGGDFSWGVFYENGSGNYRTFNEFNNEFFRGDGSLVYNGGGIAARYENAHGVYTEGSLRAGMLKSEMTDALSDGENKYGYKSESEYYGAHIGIGQIIPLSESSDLDVYGKFFHTYTEGDSFKVDTDEFEFDSINSDRLRVGARLTTNKENKFSTYYGLAYEYEFNGDAEMRAAGMKAPTQSLQGSSVMAEIGLNYQPTPDSPWSFDLNMRGYAGERQGGSFNVQATYTF